MNLKQFENNFTSLLEDLKNIGTDLKYVNRGFAMPEEIKEHALLFVGLNPSFPLNSEEGSHFYKLDHNSEGYFKKFGEMADYCGNNLNWTHLDLLPIRETNQNSVDRDVVSKFPKLTNTYLHNVSRKILEQSNPKAVVVVNATARLLLGKDQNGDKVWAGYTFDFNPTNGAYYITNSENLKGIPFFFSGMLTGQRALDLGSYERLKWHVAKVVNNELKPS